MPSEHRRMTERKYELTKIQDGEYELLGNDGKTLWRVYRYGDIGGCRGMVEVQCWGLRRQRKPLGRWERIDDGFSTRREAIQAALGYADA